MQTDLDQPPADADVCLRTQAADEKRELALLAQFMRHDSVASLAREIADRSGGSVRGGDLMAAAGLSPSRSDRWRRHRRQSSILVNPDAGLRR